MRIFIDATTGDPQTRVFGMSLVERLLHSLRRSPLEPEEVRVAVVEASGTVGPEHPVRHAVESRDLGDVHVTWEAGTGPLFERLQAAMSGAPTWRYCSCHGKTE